MSRIFRFSVLSAWLLVFGIGLALGIVALSDVVATALTVPAAVDVESFDECGGM